jgi:hypothetical protein
MCSIGEHPVGLLEFSHPFVIGKKKGEKKRSQL